MVGAQVFSDLNGSCCQHKDQQILLLIIIINTEEHIFGRNHSDMHYVPSQVGLSRILKYPLP